MRARKLFLTSAILLISGLVSLGSKWNGSAGAHAGYPISAWAVNFCGSVNGWPAMIGVLSLIASIMVFLAAVINGAVASRKA
jgi:hypothetical protein